MNSRSMKRKTCICCHVSKFSSDVCVSVCMCVCVCVRVRVCVYAQWSLFSAPAKTLFPAKSKVGGGCISTSLHYRERWGGGGGGGVGFFCDKTGRNRNVLTHIEYTHLHCLTPGGNHSVFPWICYPKRTVPLFQAHRRWNLIRYYNRHTRVALMQLEESESQHRSKTTWSHKRLLPH